MRRIILASLAVLMVVAATAWAASTPAVMTGPATNVTSTAARLHANVDPGGTTTGYNFQYGPTAAYGLATGIAGAGRGTKAVSVEVKLAGLNPGTVYHYRVDASNKLGIAFGADRTFTTTGHPLPTAVTGAASGIGTTFATMTGAVVSQGQTTSFLFEYGTTANYGLQTVAQNATAATTATPVSSTVTGLAPGTTFHYRLVAMHTGFPANNGADQTFTTLPLVRLRARVSAHTTPVHLHRRPFLFTTIGTVKAPASLPAGVGCTGVVVVRFLHGHRSVAVRRVPLQANCAFAAQVLFRRLVGHTQSRLTITARFRGSPYLRPAVSRAQRVMLG